MSKKIVVSILLVIAIAGVFFYLRRQVYFSHGSQHEKMMFEVKKGEGNMNVSENLEKDGIIKNKYYFYYYIRSHKLLNKIMPGEYQLSGSMTIPEIAHVVTNPEAEFVKLTFPEGFTAKQMAERLTANGFQGDEFLNIVNDPGELKKRYSYLTPDSVKTLEGYLFPDTYFFKKDISAQDIVGRLLDTFDAKLDDTMRADIKKGGRSIGQEIIMASIIEKEVQTPEDMRIVSGIFWKRLDAGGRLQSDAPLSYILGDNEDQHKGTDLDYDSPYNTYRYAGLPPAPIGNPGFNALSASIYPKTTDYNYFLTAAVDGQKEVFFAKTYDEHLANKNKNGL